MFAAVVLPEPFRTIMSLDILFYLKIMSHLIWPDFYLSGIFFVVTITCKAKYNKKEE